ncbi:MAG: J domain-containing protein [Dehalococcoidia bacterium]
MSLLQSRLVKASALWTVPRYHLRKVRVLVKHEAPPPLEAAPEKYTLCWKNYYSILQVSPDAKPKPIRAAFGRLARLYTLSPSDTAEKSRLFSERMTDIEEAYEVLCDSIRRDAYDREFIMRLESGEGEAGKSTKEQIFDLMAQTMDEVAKSRVRKTRRHPGWSRSARRAVLISFAALVLVSIGGTSVAFAKPDHALAAPFRGMAITVTEGGRAPIALIVWVRGVVATYERQIVSTALQSMRVEEGVRIFPTVMVPTNDMASFPSSELPLFPAYLDKEFSQFSYTVDSDGIVSVDTSWATTDALLERIELALDRFEGHR